MSNNIKPEELAEVVNKYLTNYAENIEENVKKTTDSLTKQAVQELKAKSPKSNHGRKKSYYKGWAKQTSQKNKNKYVIKIHNKTNYQLTHLLEFGHTTRDGGRTKAIPHIRPIEKKYNELYEKTIITTIQRRAR